MQAHPAGAVPGSVSAGHQDPEEDELDDEEFEEDFLEHTEARWAQKYGIALHEISAATRYMHASERASHAATNLSSRGDR